MTGSLALPLWILAVVGALALWAALDRIFMPGARWFLRRRLNRMIDEVNTRLELQIPAFQQTRRRVLIDQLSYDPQVMEAIDAEAQATGTPREVLSRQVERYAREIVPSFNAYAYFRIGYYIARRAVESLYRVRLGYADDEALARIEPGASVVFVMNHRSNMDYVIVAYMAAHRSALSYAVGEWARVWPLRMLVRSLGAYFVRRGSGSRLYRQVLACYVQAATAGGVVQAVYPEGGLSRDGRLRKPKLGLISYMVSSFDPAGTRDLVFVPVGINYDRVLEDRMLVRAPARGQPRRSRARVLATALGFAAHNVSLMLRRRWYRFGYACVNFGTPLSMRDYAKGPGRRFPRARAGRTLRGRGAARRHAAGGDRGGDPGAAGVPGRDGVRPLRRGARPAGDQGPDPGADRPAGTRGRLCPHPAGADRDYAVTVGLRMLTLRHFVTEADGLYRANEDERDMLRYYANAIEHFPARAGGGLNGRAARAGAGRGAAGLLDGLDEDEAALRPPSGACHTIAWYSGELYQALALSMLGKRKITTREGFQVPSMCATSVVAESSSAP